MQLDHSILWGLSRIKRGLSNPPTHALYAAFCLYCESLAPQSGQNCLMRDKRVW